jgi:hypothetical protein
MSDVRGRYPIHIDNHLATAQLMHQRTRAG